MERNNGYRFKTSRVASVVPTDSRKFQEQQISLLSEKFPGLDSGTIEDILAAVDWDVERAAATLQQDDNSLWEDFGNDDVYVPVPTPPKGTNLFHEITQSQQSQKPKEQYREDKNQTSRPASRAYEDEGDDGQLFPALPSSSAAWNFNYSPRRNTSPSGTEFSAPMYGATNDVKTYSPPKKPITVYNALQDSAPRFRLHKSPWNTDFANNQTAEENEEILSNFVEEPRFESGAAEQEDTDVLHDDDIFASTDGDDWFSLQLEPEFVYQLFSKYSNPFGAMDVGRLLLKDLNIKIPPKLAFELFRHLCLNLLQKLPEETNGVSPTDSFDDDPAHEFTSKLKIEENCVNGDGTTPDLRRIMELEMRLQGEEAHRVKDLRSKLQSNLATKLTIEHLQSAFPSLPLSTIEVYFVKNKSRYDETVEKLQRDFPDAFINKVNTTISQDSAAFEEAIRSDLEVLKESARHQTPRHLEGETSTDLRRKAQTHYFLMREYAQKRAECCHAPGIAEYYSKMSRLHFESMQEANRLASDMIFRENNGPGKPMDQIDLHHLTVQEALRRLSKFLHDRENYLKNSGREVLELRIVCGRGKHSDVHGPKLGPAIVRHLHSRGYSFREPLSGGYIGVTLRNRNFRPRK